MKDIYNYISYRKYLSDIYHYKKKTEDNFSYRSFSAAVGVKLINFLPWLIEGKRNLASKTVPNVINALNLDELEGDYFTLLVNFDQAKTQEEREKYWGKIVSIRAQHKKVERVEEKRYEYFSNWTTVAIRELLNVVKFNPKEEEGYYKLGSMLRPRVTKMEAHKAVKILIDMEFVEKDPSGTLILTEKQITTGDEAPGFHIREFHRQMLSRAADSMDIFPSDQRDISGISMSVSEDGQHKIKKAIQNFRHEVESIIKEDGSADRIIQLNMQMFPLAVIPDDKK